LGRKLADVLGLLHARPETAGQGASLFGVSQTRRSVHRRSRRFPVARVYK
jgi:hypothetical protein